MSVPLHRATEGDLSAHGHYLLERAYRARARAKCAREDFADGYLAALVDAGHWAAFATAPTRLLRVEPDPVIAGADPVAVHRSTR